MDDGATKRDGSGKGVLDWIERIGNMLPDPVTLFVIGAGLVVVLSQVADSLDWTVTKTVTQPVTTGTEIAEADGLSMRRVEVEVRAVGLLTRDSFYWAIKSMVDNFVQFPPLGIVLVGMLGIGVAEKTGAIGTLLK